MRNQRQSRRDQRQRRRAIGALSILVSLLGVLALCWHLLSVAEQVPAGAAPVGPRAYPPAANHAALPHQRTYFVAKQADGEMLAYSDVAGVMTPITLLPDHFGAEPTDVVAALALAPSLNYLAIDAQRDHGDLVWVLATATNTLKMTPADATGNFLRWLPDGQHFLFRPYLPTQDDSAWQPGLWIVDAATGDHVNLALPNTLTASNIIDAAPDPAGDQIVLSLTAGLGQGSSVWRIAPDGATATMLFQSAANVGLFAWSPDGRQLAYETIVDSTVPYTPAQLWLADAATFRRQPLATVDGGHGFAPVWSPDGARLAFVARLNPTDPAADAEAGLLQSAIQVATIADGQIATVAAPAQTGAPRNIAPAWQPDGALTFTAMAASSGYGAAMAPGALWRATPAQSSPARSTGNIAYQLAPSGGMLAANLAAFVAIVP